MGRPRACSFKSRREWLTDGGDKSFWHFESYFSSTVHQTIPNLQYQCIDCCVRRIIFAAISAPSHSLAPSLSFAACTIISTTFSGTAKNELCPVSNLKTFVPDVPSTIFSCTFNGSPPSSSVIIYVFGIFKSSAQNSIGVVALTGVIGMSPVIISSISASGRPL